MIGKSAMVPGFRVVLAGMFLATILAGAATVRAQQTPAQQTPAQPTQAQQQPESQQSSGQEASPEESTSRHRAKPHAYKNWTFNIGGGANLTNGTTRTFVRGGGAVAAAGVARNYSRYFGFRADFQWDNLPLRNSALELAQAPGATSQVYSLMVDPIFNIPVTKRWSGYFLVGPSYYHRSGTLDSSTAVPGSACNAFWTWWGVCFNGSLPLSGRFLTASQNEFGENLGGGVARKVRGNLEIYAEFRYLHGTHNGVTTDLRPITIGLRW
jgi:opacity protein-like surface antigen